MLSGLYNNHPDRIQGLVFLDVGYSAPMPDFDLHDVNSQVEALVGYVNYGYWEFHDEEDAGKTIDDHVSSFLRRCAIADDEKADSYNDIVFSKDPNLWRTNLGPYGQLKEWTINDRRCETAPWFSGEVSMISDERFVLIIPSRPERSTMRFSSLITVVMVPRPTGTR